MDTNYTPDEVRLLDMAAMCAISTLTGIPIDDEKATRSYDLATAMIAERRKRVPSLDADDIKAASEAMAEGPPRPYADVRKELGLDAQPQPEQAGELTEEAVEEWRYRAFGEKARATSQMGLFAVTPSEIDRAVALMREGLRAKERANCLAADLAACVVRADRAEKERDEARAEASNALSIMRAAEACTARAKARAEKAEAALAEAQPVLDAVVEAYPPTTTPWSQLRHPTLQFYADRRREQAKGAS